MIYAEAFQWDANTMILRTRAHATAADEYTARDVATGRTATAHNARTAVGRLHQRSR